MGIIWVILIEEGRAYCFELLSSKAIQDEKLIKSDQSVLLCVSQALSCWPGCDLMASMGSVSKDSDRSLNKPSRLHTAPSDQALPPSCVPDEASWLSSCFWFPTLIRGLGAVIITPVLPCSLTELLFTNQVPLITNHILIFLLLLHLAADMGSLDAAGH